MTRRRFFFYGEILCGVFVAVMSSWYLWFEPARFEYVEMPFQVLTPIVKAGESVEFVIRRDNHGRASDVKLTRQLINVLTGEKTDLLGTEMKIAIGLSGKIGRPTIPHSTQTGFYQVCGKATVPASTFTFVTRDVPWCTQTFQVRTAP